MSEKVLYKGDDYKIYEDSQGHVNIESVKNLFRPRIYLSNSQDLDLIIDLALKKKDIQSQLQALKQENEELKKRLGTYCIKCNHYCVRFFDNCPSCGGKLVHSEKAEKELQVKNQQLKEKLEGAREIIAKMAMAGCFGCRAYKEENHICIATRMDDCRGKLITKLAKQALERLEVEE